MLKIINVVGARPNFMKVAPLVEAMKRQSAQFTPLVVHTGQHYDSLMSDLFFRDLDLPTPDVYLGVGSASHAAQTAAVMERFEPVVIREKPDWVLVVGDVNSTLACALVCVKLGVKVAHVEAGLRSGDRTMPEEINRLLTDQIADLLFTPSPDADANLLAEGIPKGRIRFVGNIMIDSLYKHLERARQSRVREQFGLTDSPYAVLTLHRPSNVDDLELLGFLDFLALYSNARLVLTDSGGLQEETTVLGIPCLTLRENTERPVTVEVGTNIIVGTDPDKIATHAFAALNGTGNKTGHIPQLWDGHTAERILSSLS